MSRHKIRRGALFAAVAGVLALAVTAGLSSVGVAGGELADAPSADSAGLWRSNDSGQTYGSKHFATSADDEPDLIAVVATNGREGYCYKTEYELPEPKTVEEATAETKANLRGREVPVYEADGVSRIGVFLIGGPGTMCIGRKADGTEVTMTADESGTIITTLKAPDGTVTEVREALDGTVTKSVTAADGFSATRTE